MKFGLRFCLFILFVIPFFTSNSFSQTKLWSDISESSIVLIGEKLINPSVYRTVTLNVDAMKELLNHAPLEFSREATNNPLVVSLPIPDGSFQNFYCVESPVMHPDLAARYPEIKTYVGHGIDDRRANVRFDFTPHGFHAMIHSPKGNVFIDPHNKGDIENYIVYYTKDF